MGSNHSRGDLVKKRFNLLPHEVHYLVVVALQGDVLLDCGERVSDDGQEDAHQADIHHADIAGETGRKEGEVEGESSMMVRKILIRVIYTTPI